MEKKFEETLQEVQFGFRRNPGTWEAILSLWIIIEKLYSLNREIMIAFVEIKNAFDNDNWNVCLLYTSRCV